MQALPLTILSGNQYDILDNFLSVGILRLHCIPKWIFRITKHLVGTDISTSVLICLLLSVHLQVLACCALVALALFADAASATVAKGLSLPKVDIGKKSKCVDLCENKCQLVESKECKDVPVKWTECKPVKAMETIKKCASVCKPMCTKVCAPVLLPKISLSKSKGLSVTKPSVCKDICKDECKSVCKDVQVESKKVECKEMTKTEKKCTPKFNTVCKKVRK